MNAFPIHHRCFSPLLQEVLLQVLWFSPLLKNQHLQIQIQPGNRIG